MFAGMSWSRCRPLVPFIAVAALGLSACGGSGTSSGSVSAPGTPVSVGSPPATGTPAPGTLPPGSTTPPGIDIGATPPITVFPVIGAVLPDPLPDADRDGIPDHLDPYPDEPPALAPLAGPGAIQLERAWSELEGHALDGVAFVGRTLYLQGPGLDGAAAGGWVVFQTLDGRTAVRPEERSGGGWQATAPALATGVHVVLDNRRTGSLDLLQPDHEAPLLFPLQVGFRAGGTAVVQGRNLAGVTQAVLGDTALRVLEGGADFLRLELPPHTSGNTLQVRGARGSSNPVAMDVYRDVILEVDASVPATAERPLHGYIQGRRFSLAPGRPATIEVPAHRTMVQLLDFELPSGQGLYGAVGVTLWPDVTHATVSLQSTLVADLARVTRGRPEATASGWSGQREVLDDAWSRPEAREFEAGLAAYLANGTQFPRYELRGRLMDALFTPFEADSMLADAPPVLGEAVLDDLVPPILSDGLGPAIGPGRRLDDAIPFTVSLGAPERPDMPLGTYAQFTVTTHEDTFLLFNVCRFPGGLAPTGIAPSDLCVQNSTPMPASAAVYMPNRFTYGAPYTPRDSDRVRSHIDRLIDGNAFRDSAVYLTSDSGVPLCGMRPCYIELLTGGLGLGHKVSLSTREESIVQLLRLRWILEEYVVDELLELIGLSPTASMRSCMIGGLVGDVAFIDSVAQFVAQVRANPSAAAEIYNATIGRHVIDTALGYISNLETIGKIEDCALQQLTAEVGEVPGWMRGRVLARLGAVPAALGGVLKFLSILNKSMHAGGILLTPEKILFKVVYRGEITDFSTEADDPFWQPIDLYDLRRESGNDRMLRIYGDWIANTGLASDEDTFYPTLVFRDRRDARRRFPLDASHLIDQGGKNRQLAVSVAEIGFGTGPSASPATSLSGLDSGPLDFWLEYSHPDFTEYPAGVLKIPSSARIDFNGVARITTFNPPGVPAGSRVTATGNRLDDFSERPVVLLVDGTTGAAASGPPLTARVQGGKLHFTIPETVLPGHYRVELGDGHGQLDAIVSEADLVVAPVPDPHLTLSDWRGNDDFIRVELRASGSSFSLYDLQVPDGNGRSAATLPWDRGAPVGELRVVCEDPGADATCTYRLSLERAELELPTGDWVRDYSSQLLRGETADFPLRF